MASTKEAARDQGLDVLRAGAVLLVLGRHKYLTHYWFQAGWAGVDLFFVLSGFLISGLLFAEYRRSGSIRVGRFLVRRGFKIYPPYYFLLLVTVVADLLGTPPPGSGPMLSEVFFLHGYAGFVWNHTWSLAVEEHFYVLLPCLLVYLAHRPDDHADPFRVLPRIFLLMAGGLLVLRAATALGHTFERVFIPTHLRIDSLLAGVVISYYFHFQPGRLHQLTRHPRRLLALSLLLLSPLLALGIEDVPMHTLGFSFLYLGFGGLLILVVGQCLGGTRWRVTAPLLSLLAALGRRSYSIYLWHMPVAVWGIAMIRGRGLWLAPPTEFIVYFAGSLAVGVAMFHLIESPALRLRDRLVHR